MDISQSVTRLPSSSEASKAFVVCSVLANSKHDRQKTGTFTVSQSVLLCCVEYIAVLLYFIFGSLIFLNIQASAVCESLLIFVLSHFDFVFPNFTSGYKQSNQTKSKSKVSVFGDSEQPKVVPTILPGGKLWAVHRNRLLIGHSFAFCGGCHVTLSSHRGQASNFSFAIDIIMTYWVEMDKISSSTGPRPGSPCIARVQAFRPSDCKLGLA